MILSRCRNPRNHWIVGDDNHSILIISLCIDHGRVIVPREGIVNSVGNGDPFAREIVDPTIFCVFKAFI